jgi:hypothetical protein
MTAVQPVSGPGLPFGRRDRAVALVVTIGVLTALAKPWGDDRGGDRTGTTALPLVGAAATPSPVTLPGHAWDPKMFGPFEPAPDWSVWPAGYFISVQFVTREAIDRPVSGQSPAPPASGVPAETSRPLPPPPPDQPDWPTTIDIGPGDHLLWLGIDAPLGWTFREFALRRLEANGSHTAIAITRLPSEWDDHFAVLGVPVDTFSDRLTDWPPGTYRLDITVDPGRITRTIQVNVMTEVHDRAPALNPDRTR